MSATTVDLRRPAWRPAARRLGRMCSSPVAQVLLVSRLLIFVAGIAGAEEPRRTAWQAFDPNQLSSSMGRVGDVLAGAAVRWDAIHYLDIAAHGYRPTDTVFYPLYPFLVRVLGLATGSLALAGVLVSLGALGVALWLLGDLTARELGRPAARATIALMAFAPLSFFFSAVYTESLFLALSLGSFHAAYRDRWPLAVSLAVLATLTRVTGVLLVAPLVLIAWQAGPRRIPRIAAAAAIPAALLLFAGFLALHGLDPSSPFTGEAYYGRVSTGPLGAFVLALKSAAGGVWLLTIGPEPIYGPSIHGPLSFGAQSIALFAVLCASLWTLRIVWARLSRPLAVYAVAAVAVCLWSPTTSQPLMSFDRYLLTIFPLWMVAGAWLSRREAVRIAVGGVSAALLAFYAFQFGTWAFIA